MTHEGMTLLWRGLLVAVLIVAGAIALTGVRSNRKRGEIMLAGTLVGMTLGVLIAYPLSAWLHTDVSAVCATLGMPLGWAVSWCFARRIPQA